MKRALSRGRYISLERLIEQNKERYYATRKTSSQGWHQGKQNPWPYVGFRLYTLKDAYREFEQQVGSTASPRGAKSAPVVAAVRQTTGPFRIATIQQACPGPSIDLIRRVVRNLREQKAVRCHGRGQQAQWEVIDRAQLATT